MRYSKEGIPTLAVFYKHMLRLEYQKLVAARGRELSVAELQAMPEEDLLQLMGPPGLGQRKREWDVFHAERSGACGYMCDLDHHPQTKGVGAGMLFPVQLKHGTICSYGEAGTWRIATAKEHMCANGFRALPATTTKGVGICPLVPVLDSMNVFSRSIKFMSGNGMNLVTQTAWMAYVLSNIARIDRKHDAS